MTDQPFTQPQLPGVDWSRYEHREVPTDEQIADALPDDDYYLNLAAVLLEQYNILALPGQLRVAEAMAVKRYAYDQMQAAIRA